jgi:hypothetical protein
MATVVMKKGDLFADIFDSPETIAQAQKKATTFVPRRNIKKTRSNTLVWELKIPSKPAQNRRTRFRPRCLKRKS